MGRRGEISVFLALILVSVWAVLCGLVESARTAGARCYMRQVLDSSMDSLMSQYHRELWQNYRILGLEYGSREDLEGELMEFMQPYLETDNWYPMEAEQTRIQEMSVLTDQDGQILEGQILEYMKYGLLDLDWDQPDQALTEQAERSIKEAETVTEVSRIYGAHTKEAVKLEKALEKLDQELGKQRQEWQRAANALAACNGDGFLSAAGKLKESLKRVPILVAAYSKAADRLGEALEDSRREFEAKKGDLSQEVRDGLETEISQYESYTRQDGTRRIQIEGLSPASEANITWIEKVEGEARSVQDYIDSWEPDEDSDEELDEEALWRPVESRWNAYPMLAMDVAFGIANKEKQGFLERVSGMASGSLLALVLPEGVQASGRRPDLAGAPSVMYGGVGQNGAGQNGAGQNGAGQGGAGQNSSGQNNAGGGRTGLLDRVIIGEYVLRFFNRYGDGDPEDGCCAYETEYILYGHAGDQENLAAVVGRLLAVREGMNLIHILSDTTKREAARGLAMAIVGGTGILPLVDVVAFFIMGVWALGEALLDVRTLLDSGKVPFMKNQESWRLGLEGLLDMGKSGKLTDDTSNDTGMDYRAYLRMLLFFGHGPGTDYRMMDMIQANLRKEQEGFRIDHCAHSVATRTTVCGKHLFFTLGLWISETGGGDMNYCMTMAASAAYQ